MPTINCAQIALNVAQAAMVNKRMISALCGWHPNAIESASDLREAICTIADCPVSVILADDEEISIRWEWWSDAVGVAVILLRNRSASLVIAIDGRDPVAEVEVRTRLASLGVTLPTDVAVDASRHTLVVATLPPRVIENPLVSILPFALIFPAFAECRGLA